MRCRFQLAYPSNGMYGGGRGECQLPGGKAIDVKFPPRLKFAPSVIVEVPPEIKRRR